MIPADVGKAAKAFQLPGEVVHIERHGDGLIHDTFVVQTSGPDGPKRFILQHINKRVFAKPVALMENIERVVMHVQQKASRTGRNPERATPSLIRTKTDCLLHRADCESWRMLQYVEGTTTIAGAPSAEQAHQIGLTFGQFLDDLADFAPCSLQNALPGYGDTESYLAALWQAVSKDSCNRAKDAREDIAFVEDRVKQTMRLQNLQRSGRLPLRVIHGDTKLNNVLLDIESGAGVCAIDLDTVMPGLLLHDIGDCVSEALVGIGEQPTNLSEHDLHIFEALVNGFVSGQSQLLTELESENIVSAVSSITLELGTRFLCDYLSGDIYFRTAAALDNLLRAQCHFRLQQRIEASLSGLQACIQRSARSA